VIAFESQLIGCPVAPTASLLALSPLLKQGLIVPETAIIDAKSGTSGGGRQAKVGLLLAEQITPLGAWELPVTAIPRRLRFVVT